MVGSRKSVCSLVGGSNMTVKTHHSATLEYSLSSRQQVDDPYWLTIEQIKTDDKATLADVATVVDAMFNLSPCADTSKTGTTTTTTDTTIPDDSITDAQIIEMRDKLLSGASDVLDPGSCKVLLSGDFTTNIKIIRSHPDTPYALRLSTAGSLLDALKMQTPVSSGPKIIETVKKSEFITLTIDVKSATSAILTYPVLPYPTASPVGSVSISDGYDLTSPSVTLSLSASWLGWVVRDDGNNIENPTIYALHNTLFWDGGAVTGTIRATFYTTYDLVEILVPGVLQQGSTTVGQTQECTILAFYHFLVYSGNASAPAVDTTTSADVKTGVCTPQVVTGVDLTPPATPKEFPDKSEYGCQYRKTELGSREMFKKLCCHYPGGTPSTCAESWDAKPAKGMSAADKADLNAKHLGDAQFMAVPPCGAEGCGKIITSVIRKQHKCCLERPKVEWDSSSSIETIAPSHSGYVFVIGGDPPYDWKIQGTGFSLNGDYLRIVTTDVPYVRVFAASFACGYAPITVSDNCTSVEGGVRCTVGQWFLIPGAGCPWTMPAAGHTTGLFGYSGISGKYKVLQNANLISAYGTSDTRTYCNDCHPTDVGSCFSGWAAGSGTECPYDYEVGGNCLIEIHSCQYVNILGTYCFNQTKGIYRWGC